MVGACCFQIDRRAPAALGGEGAAWMEPATREQLAGAGSWPSIEGSSRPGTARLGCERISPMV